METTTEERARQSRGASHVAIYRMVARVVAGLGVERGYLLDVGCGCGQLRDFIAPYFACAMPVPISSAMRASPRTVVLLRSISRLGRSRCRRGRSMSSRQSRQSSTWRIPVSSSVADAVDQAGGLVDRDDTEPAQSDESAVPRSQGRVPLLPGSARDVPSAPFQRLGNRSDPDGSRARVGRTADSLQQLRADSADRPTLALAAQRSAVQRQYPHDRPAPACAGDGIP